MDDQRECEVARGLRQGNTEAWQALYDAYCKRVWWLAARQMGANSADVADVVQETFLAAARSARNYDAARGSLWLWLGGIARRHVALHYRKQKRHDRLKKDDQLAVAVSNRLVHWLENREAQPGEALATAELAAKVRSALTELSTDYETLLTAKYCDGVSVEQIAGLQNCSSTAVRSKLARARRAFRRAFVKTSTCSRDAQAGGTP